MAKLVWRVKLVTELQQGNRVNEYVTNG